MRITIEQLRTGIVGLGLLLIAGILGFLGFAHYQRRFFNQDLPSKLGMHIESSANGFTYSQSDKRGRTLFLLHASNVVRYKEGSRATLRDVSITLYGADGDRNDRIYGDKFEYDPPSGILKAQGEVQIDLGPAEPENSTRAPSRIQGEAQEEKTTVHVKTSELVFNTKTSAATTDQNVEFHFPKAAGTAIGASYDSQKGILILQRAVELSSSVNGDPLEVHATHAHILRTTQKCYLQNVSTDFRNERSTAEEAVVLFRKDGSAEHIDARGNIHFHSDSGQEVTAQAGEMQLDQHSDPLSAHLSQGVAFTSEDSLHHMHGTAVEVFMSFAAKSAPRHARLLNSVSVVDQQVGLPEDPHGSLSREVRGSQVDVDFVTDAQQHTTAKTAFAQGGATIVLHTVRTKGPQPLTTIEGDSLLANLTPQMAVSKLTGTGHTKLTDLAADGTTQVSTGDSLLIRFNSQSTQDRGKEQKTKKSSKSEPSVLGRLDPEASQIESALQSGHVTLLQQPPKGKTAADGSPVSPLTATAEKADYQAAQQNLQLTGSPHVHNGSLDMTAQIVDYSRAIGDATASGDVKATYLQTEAKNREMGTGKSGGAVFGGQGPVHIIATKAHLDHATGDATFTGQARLWQESNSVAAPILELSRARQTLKAHNQVSATFLSSEDSKQGPSVVRISSHDLIYSDAERKGVFRGAVVAQSGDVTIHSSQAEVFLSEARTQNSVENSQVDHLIASGNTVLTQPGRRATGEKLVYTASDGRFILTGTNSVLPHLYDVSHGNVTGDALIFSIRDDSVNVEGQGQKSITETRTPR
jgi:lipopolysaccharide export system protein LptA